MANCLKLNNIQEEELCKRIFEKWKKYTKTNRDYKEKLNKNSQKLEVFLQTLKKHRNKKLSERRRCKTSTSTKSLDNNGCNIRHSPKVNDSEVNSHTFKKIKIASNSACFENRLKAQRYIILQQKHTIFQQKQTINELQLGKLDETINKSLEETEKDLQEALLNCSVKLKYKKRLLLNTLDTCNDESFHQFQLNSSKVPKIVQQMEKRAFERQQKRLIIMEKKKLLNQLKKEAVEREIARKKALSEEERKRNIKEMKERRKRELEAEQRKQLKKRQFLENCFKADSFYNKSLKKMGLESFIRLIAVKEDNEIKSVIFYERTLERKAMQKWIIFISRINQEKIDKANNFYNVKLRRYYFKLWLDEYNLSIQHIQVAQDLYDLILQSKIFIHWHRYTCSQYVLQIRNIQKAQRHYNSRILLHYFYQWKSLPAVIRLEKAKEEKKRKWREKVWEVLVDFAPVVED